jgi:hypothetical protein
MLIPGMLIRRALKGELPLIAAAKRLQDEVLSPSSPSAGFADSDGLDDEMRAVVAFKKVALMVLGTGDADLRRGVDRSTGGPELRRRHSDRHLLGGERSPARARGAGHIATTRRVACRCHACVRQRCSTARRKRGTQRHWRRWPKAIRFARCSRRCRRVLKVTPINTVALRRTLAEAATEHGGYVVA